MAIPLPDTIQTPEDIKLVKLPGAKWTVSTNGNVIVTKWQPSYETAREVVFNWDFDRRILMLANDQPADEPEVTAALAAVGEPDPKLSAGKEISERLSSLAGKDIRDLTANQLKLLLAVVVWNMKGLNLDGTLKPPGQWVKNRES